MTSTSSYIQNPESRVFTKTGFNGIGYSDGSISEQKMLAYIKSCTDISDASHELRQGIVDWMSEYHLSPFRSNLLRPFNFSGKLVLELGCGCGALTRLLGESGATVIAVDGSPMRTTIAAERCRDLPNVSIYCDNLVDFEYPEKFDVVTLIGVLEYSNLYINDAAPIQACLKKVASLLKPNGDLYLAIENQLGLKYFNGLSEDHIGLRYFGIHDLYNSHTPITFGKRELADILCSSGFIHQDFFYPFPDYKLPEIILSETAMTHPSLKVGDLLHSIKSRSYDKQSPPSFYEGLAWQVLARNKLVGELSNSFLVKASANKKLEKPSWVARIYSSSRLKEFATETIFNDTSGAIIVSKKAIFSTSATQANIRHLLGKSDYVQGSLYITKLQKIIARNGSLEEIMEWTIPWIDFLKLASDDNGTLPSHYIDCIPTNIIYDAENNFTYIDAEWELTIPASIQWVITRGLIRSLSMCPTIKNITNMSLKEFILKIMNFANIPINEDDFQFISKLERDLISSIFGNFTEAHDFEDWFYRRTLPWETYLTESNRVNKEINKLDQHIISLEHEINLLTKDRERIKNTMSWKITKPLRAIWNFLFKPKDKRGDRE